MRHNIGPMCSADLSIIVTSFERPGNLQRALLSLAVQRDLSQAIEVIVADDGSRDHTPEVVEEFRRSVRFPVRWVTHAHDAFRPGRCRNEGFALSTAPYVVFLDGDCVAPPDHLAAHFQRRRRGIAMTSDCCRLDHQTSQRVTESVVRSGEYLRWIPPGELRRLAAAHWRACFYDLIRHPTKPRLVGNNVGIWRDDYQRVNGYDESYAGWGCEDDDLGIRLHQAGIRVRSLRRWTWTCHLWHPPVATVPKKYRQGVNVAYFERQGRLARCRHGLVKRATSDLDVRVVGRPARPDAAARLLPGVLDRPSRSEPPEVEILFLPGSGRFTGRADCNVLVVLEDAPAISRAARRAHLVIADKSVPGAGAAPHFPLDQFAQAMDSIA